MESASSLSVTRWENRLAAIQDALSDGIITIGADGIILEVNPAAEQIFGYETGALPGKNVSILVPVPHHASHDAYIGQYLSSGKAKIIGSGRQVEGRRGDGSLFPMYLRVSDVVEGDSRLFVGIVKDLSSQVEAVRQLRLQATALEFAANAIVITDRAGHIEWVNPAFTDLTGYLPSEAVGKNPRILKSGHHPTEFFHDLWETVLAGKVWRGETVNRKKDGSIYIEEQTITPVTDPAGRLTHFVAIKNDITARKEAERLKREFVATVSHELRTPLTSIRGSLGLMTGGVCGPLPKQVGELLSIAERNCQRLGRLIDDLLDIEKIESGKLAFSIRAVELQPLLDQAVEGASAYAAQFGVAFRTTGTAVGGRVKADPDRLVQVLANLLSNAAKFSPMGASVDISVVRRANYLRVSVSDRGPGIPEEFRPRIFEKFAQADSSDSRQKGGTGLGLHISRAIVERLGGRLDFESVAGEGSTFYFELPEWEGDDG